MRPLAHLHRLASWPHAWLAVLVLLLAVSLLARVWDIAAPCARPCRTPAQHTLIFDEAYYVNAARVIDGLRPPPGQPYASAPAGSDPNAEHPQLAKLIIAGTIRLFGDDPWGWRSGSIAFGLLALVGMFGLVRAAGGGHWLAVGATAVMAADNLALVHSRIATLDIYVLAMMLWAAVAYLRGRPLLAGALLGLGGAMKLVGLSLLATLLLLEAMGLWQERSLTRLRPLAAAGGRLLRTTASAAAVLLGSLWLMDMAVPAYDPGSHRFYRGDPFAHLAHMLSFAARLTTRAGAPGLASSPWQWLLDQKPITYARTAVSTLSGHTLISQRTLVFFRGEVNPFIIFLAIPAVCAMAGALVARRRAVATAGSPPAAPVWHRSRARVWHRSRGAAGQRARRAAPAGAPGAADRVAAVALAWCVGTFAPFVVEADAFHRVTYLFYILIVLPGVYLALAALFARLGAAATVGLALALGFGFVHQYPIRTLGPPHWS